jgi:hypothetical protein
VAGSRVPDVVAAAIAALRTDGTLTGLLGTAKVYTHVPLGTDPPYLVVMGGDEMPFGTTLTQDLGTFNDSGDSGGRQVDVWVQCVSTHRGTEQVDTLASRVMEVLTESSNWTGVTALSDFQLADFIRNSAQVPTDLNGVLWFQRLVVVRVSLL